MSGISNFGNLGNLKLRADKAKTPEVKTVRSNTIKTTSLSIFPKALKVLF